MTENRPSERSKPIDAFLEQMSKQQMSARGRLAFIIDATASREPTWDMATQLQMEMFEEATKFSSLEVQLIFFRGLFECQYSGWITEGRTLARLMAEVRCEGGFTKIGRALAHVRREHERQKIDAAVFVGDAMEESHDELCGAAGTLSLPLFMFQEGDAPKASRTFAEMARLSHGAHCRFDAGAARRLGDYLRAVGTFAAGGVRALEKQDTDAARKLLGQLRR